MTPRWWWWWWWWRCWWWWQLALNNFSFVRSLGRSFIRIKFTRAGFCSHCLLSTKTTLMPDASSAPLLLAHHSFINICSVCLHTFSANVTYIPTYVSVCMLNSYHPKLLRFPFHLVFTRILLIYFYFCTQIEKFIFFFSNSFGSYIWMLWLPKLCFRFVFIICA